MPAPTSKSHILLYEILAAILVGICAPLWLSSNHWFIGEQLSFWDPISWLKVAGMIGGVLLGNVHQQSAVGAFFGAGLLAACFSFILIFLLVRISRKNAS